MDYYFVLEGDKVIGFNLTEKEKNELFYHIDKGDGHRSSDGRAYGAIKKECEDEEDFTHYLDNRNKFLTTKNKDWIDVAVKEYKFLVKVYNQMKRDKNPMEQETRNLIMELENENGLYYSTSEEYNF
jgi:hypothetical protein